MRLLSRVLDNMVEDVNTFKRRSFFSVLCSWVLMGSMLYFAHAYGKANWVSWRNSFSSDFRFWSVFNISTNIMTNIIGNLFFLTLYLLQIPAVEKYKANNSVDWPWKSEKKEERERFFNTLKSSIKYVGFNLFVITPLSAMSSYNSLYESGLMGDMSIENFPTLATLVKQLIGCALIEDFLFFCSHSLLHTKRFNRFHAVHHNYYHPVSLSAEHAHVFEFIIGNLLPVIIPACIFRMHLFSFGVWVIYRVSISLDEHSGYALPCNPFQLIPFDSCADGHDYHHRFNAENFASQFKWWDSIFGTSVNFRAFFPSVLQRREDVVSGKISVNEIKGKKTL